MSRAAESLRRRRERLIAESEAQREDLARAAAELELPLKLVDAGIRIGGLARRRTGGAPSIASLRPAAGRILGIGWRLFVLWQAARLAREIVAQARGVRARMRIDRWRRGPLRRSLPGPPTLETPHPCDWKRLRRRAGGRR